MFTIVSDNIEVLQESPTQGPRPTRGPKPRPGSTYVTPPKGTMTIVDFSPQPLASTLANQLNQRLGAESKSTGLLCNAGSRVASKPLIGITSSCTTTAKAGGTHCMRASVRVRVVRVRARLMMLAETKCISGEPKASMAASVANLTTSFQKDQAFGCNARVAHAGATASALAWSAQLQQRRSKTSHAQCV